MAHPLMRVLLRYLLPMLIALPVGFLLLYPQLLRCARVGESPVFRRLPHAGPVYVSRTATVRQVEQLRQHIQAARDRIGRFWGDRRGRAVLIYCPRQADYEQYCVGGEGAGCSLGTPWGASYLVLGPEGNNADVIAHELCHDELFTRLGWWRVKRQIPQWFNEGLALMVDYRFSSPVAWMRPAGRRPNPGRAGPPAPAGPPARGTRPDSSADAPAFEDDVVLTPMVHPLRLSQLETTRDFFGGDYGHVMLAYQTAADELTRWLAVVGRAGVPRLTAAVANGADFGDTYRHLERTGRARHPAK